MICVSVVLCTSMCAYTSTDCALRIRWSFLPASMPLVTVSKGHRCLARISECDLSCSGHAFEVTIVLGGV